MDSRGFHKDFVTKGTKNFDHIAAGWGGDAPLPDAPSTHHDPLATLCVHPVLQKRNCWADKGRVSTSPSYKACWILKRDRY